MRWLRLSRIGLARSVWELWEAGGKQGNGWRRRTHRPPSPTISGVQTHNKDLSFRRTNSNEAFKLFKSVCWKGGSEYLPNILGTEMTGGELKLSNPISSRWWFWTAWWDFDRMPFSSSFSSLSTVWPSFKSFYPASTLHNHHHHLSQHQHQ